MYTDLKQWSKIRNRILSGKDSIREMARETGISRGTIRKMVDFPCPQPYQRHATAACPKLDAYKARIQLMLSENKCHPARGHHSAKEIYQKIRDEDGFEGGYTIVKDFIRPIKPDDDTICSVIYDLLHTLEKRQGIELIKMLSSASPPIIVNSAAKRLYREAARLLPKQTAIVDKRREIYNKNQEWMRALMQKDFKNGENNHKLDNVSGIDELLRHLYYGRLTERNRSMAIISHQSGIDGQQIRQFLGINKHTYYKYLHSYNNGGIDGLFARKASAARKYEDEDLKQAVFRTLHEPPSRYKINRTSWIMRDFTRILREGGHPACDDVIRKITKKAGYRWRKARIQLTSRDPEYREKLAVVQAILGNLKEDEVFFSIDEFGPFSIKMKQGLKLDPPGPHRVVPQWQKSKGCLIMTAALELSANQVTHFYSQKKNTAEMIRMAETLILQYADRRTIYLSWDAASWHISKKLKAWIGEHNDYAKANGGPIVRTAPLPAGAQFLNVIESIFSGMARAIIHSSDYQSVDAAKAAIDQYFTERNQHFKENPQRAGKRIWGEELVPPVFSDSNNCKDPRWR